MDFSTGIPHQDHWSSLFRWGSWAAIILLTYSVITLLIVVLLGAAPATAQECFQIIQNNPWTGVLRLDVLTVLAMPVFLFLYVVLCRAMYRSSVVSTTVGAASAFLGVTLVVSNASVLSMVQLSKQYVDASTEARKAIFLAAGEAVMSTDMWHATSAVLGGVLIQVAGVLICIVMVRGGVFSRLTGYLGIVTHVLDLAHILVSLFLPAAGIVLMALAGPLYLVWLPLVGRRLYQLSCQAPIPEAS